MSVQFDEREMTNAEFARMNAGFDEHTVEFGNPVEVPERHGFVITNGDTFVGCASGLAYKHATETGDVTNRYFYLTDLFVEKAYRGCGYGAEVLRRLEARVAAIDGITHLWTWTAGYEAPGFYQKQGWEIFAELPHAYATGHSRIALKKALAKNE